MVNGWNILEMIPSMIVGEPLLMESRHHHKTYYLGLVVNLKRKSQFVIDGLICPKTTELYCPNLAEIYVRQNYGILSV